MHTIAEVEEALGDLRKSTLKAFYAITDQSLPQEVAPGFRTLGQIAWHIVTTIPEMMNHTGLEVESVGADAPVPDRAEEIVKAFEEVSLELIEQIKSKWTDDTLEVVDEMYGCKWPRSLTLAILHSHAMYHLGQLSVLMRQAGLKVPGICGPAKEEWAELGMEAPAL